MKRLSTLFVILVVLVVGYVGYRWLSKPAPFVAPTPLYFDALDTASIDGLRLVFSEGKEIEVLKTNGTWRLNGAPADASKIEEVLAGLKGSTVESRVSGNAEYHDRFDVGTKGIRLTVLRENQVLHELIVGKTAGGDAVYVRLPEQNEVFVLSGLPRYTLTEDPTTWRDRVIASFKSEQVRDVNYTENLIQWQLNHAADGWSLLSKRLLPVVVDEGKAGRFIGNMVALQAVGFPANEEVEAAKQNRATSANVVFEVGTVQTFERKEAWLVYATTDITQWLVVRESDGVGYYVSKNSFDEVLGDYAQTKSAVTLTEEEKQALDPATTQK